MTAAYGIGTGSGANAGLLARLTPYQVGLCSLLARYARCGDAASSKCDMDISDGTDASLVKEDAACDEAEQRLLFELLRREIQAARGPQCRDLEELGRELRNNSEYATLWVEHLERL